MKGDTDVENGYVDTVGDGESGTNRECNINIYALLCVEWLAGEKLLYNTGDLWSPREVGWEGIEVQEGGNICIIMAYSRCCMKETNTAL